MTRRGVDPLPHLNSERDWRRHERGLYRESTALNEDIFMYVAFVVWGCMGGGVAGIPIMMCRGWASCHAGTHWS